VNYAIEHGHAKSFDSDAAGTELNSRPRDGDNEIELRTTNLATILEKKNAVVQ